jgi:large subunit ribosomal protein L17
MRHRVHAKKVGRTGSHRLAMYRNLVTSLLDHEKLETTDVKAKQVRRLADRMITLGKRGDLHARRQALRVLREKDVAAKLFGELAERYENRPGGYTRVIHTRRRVGDNASMAIVELVEPLERAAAGKGGKKSARKKKAEAKKTRGKKATKKAAPAKGAGKKTSTRKAAARKKSSAGRSKRSPDAD